MSNPWLNCIKNKGLSARETSKYYCKDNKTCYDTEALKKKNCKKKVGTKKKNKSSRRKKTIKRTGKKKVIPTKRENTWKSCLELKKMKPSEVSKYYCKLNGICFDTIADKDMYCKKNAPIPLGYLQTEPEILQEEIIPEILQEEIIPEQMQELAIDFDTGLPPSMQRGRTEKQIIEDIEASVPFFYEEGDVSKYRPENRISLRLTDDSIKSINRYMGEFVKSKLFKDFFKITKETNPNISEESLLALLMKFSLKTIEELHVIKEYYSLKNRLRDFLKKYLQTHDVKDGSIVIIDKNPNIDIEIKASGSGLYDDITEYLSYLMDSTEFNSILYLLEIMGYDKEYITNYLIDILYNLAKVYFDDNQLIDIIAMFVRDYLKANK